MQGKEDRIAFMKEKKIEQIYVYFGLVMLFAAILVNAWMTHRYYFNFINSDEGAELILARMLAQDGGILSKNWHYSTELEVLNTQLVYSFLFRFISDFKTVRIVGQVILTCIYLACYYFCLYSMDEKAAGKRFCKTAFLMLFPVSGAWTFLIMKTYYIPHVGISFLMLGLACQMQKEDLSNRKKILFLVLGCVLAFVGCLEGMKRIQLAYLPLVLSFICILWNSLEKAAWDLKKVRIPQGMWASICWLVSAGAGCMVNIKVLSDIYSVYSYTDSNFSENFSFESVQNVWNALLKVVGYKGEQELISIGGICNALAVLLACVFIYHIVKMVKNGSKEGTLGQLIIYFAGISLALGIFIFIVLNTVEAYWVLACALPAILLLLFLERMPRLKYYLTLGGIYCVVLMFGICGYQEIRTGMKNEDKRNVYDFVQANDYSYGYCTMWVGDWLTEMTNGSFATRSVIGDYLNDKLMNWHWLTPVEVDYHEEPVLCILEKRRVEDISIPEEWPVLMEDEYYIIYELTDHKRVEEYLEKREAVY